MQVLETIKMEDRKRPAVDDSRDAHPSKRQAVQVNGAVSHPDTDMPWRDDLEEFTKDALQRRMREYKREAQTTRDQLSDITKRAEQHDSHVRWVDMAISQLVDEIAIACGHIAPSEKPEGYKPLEASLLSASPEVFEKHFQAKSAHVKTAIADMFEKLPGSHNTVEELQQRLAKLLTDEKEHASELSKASQEQEQLEERLENASLRYMMAEKKNDRMKSQAVQKLEAAAKAPPAKTEESEGAATADDSKLTNGVSDQDVQGIETAKKEAIAAKEEVSRQLTKLESENLKLTETLTAAQLKQASLTDEDYANTDLYKTLRAQHEDVIKRVNDLQATHVQLREDLKKLHAERMSYKDEADKEAQEATIDAERQVSGLESDLARIRKGRDEALSELSIVKANGAEAKDSVKQAAEFSAAQTARIAALDLEVQRLKQTAESSLLEEELNGMSNEQLVARLKLVDGTKCTLEKELASMGTAWQKAQAAATKKWSVLVEAEDKVGKLNAEKARADQKYFAAMKAKEVQGAELRTLKMQNAKTSDIISQLKEAETTCRSLVSQVEKQLAEARDSLAQLTQTHRTLQQESFVTKKKLEQVTSQQAELEAQLKRKDTASSTAMQGQHKAEQELKELQVRLEDTQKSLESWRERGSSSQGTEFDMLKNIATCSVCRHNFKSTALKSCGHVFCDKCIQERVANRARKCPNCGKAFGQGDFMKVVL